MEAVDGVTWLEDAEADDLTREWHEDLEDEDLAFASPLRVVGTAGERARRMSGDPCPLFVVADPEGRRLLLPSLAFPPRGMPRTDDLAAALRDYRRPLEPATALPRSFRTVLGVELDSVDPIVSTLAALEPWMDDAWYGAAHDDDPYDVLSDPPRPIERILVQRTAFDQHPNRAESWSVRTLWSRSVVRIERHPYGLWVFDVAYRPVSTDPGAPARLAGVEVFPTDLPVDVQPCMLRGSLLPARSVTGAFDGPPVPYTLAAGCALAVGDVEVAAGIDDYALQFVGTEHEALAVEILGNFERNVALARVGLRSDDARPTVERMLGGEA